MCPIPNFLRQAKDAVKAGVSTVSNSRDKIADIARNAVSDSRSLLSKNMPGFEETRQKLSNAVSKVNLDPLKKAVNAVASHIKIGP